jgi:hypothetical protein
MILDNRDFWDAAALDAVIAYKGGPRQAWDHTDIAGPWLNGMRNTLNTQVFAFNEPNFLCVSGTHGAAHLALFDQPTWDKYQLAKLAGGNIRSNTFIVVPPAASHDPADFQSPDGVFSPQGNNIAVLQRRGVVFLACHNAIWELAERLIAENQNPDHLAIDALASDLTNHLIPDAVLTPGVVPTLVKLRRWDSCTPGEKHHVAVACARRPGRLIGRARSCCGGAIAGRPPQGDRGHRPAMATR